MFVLHLWIVQLVKSFSHPLPANGQLHPQYVTEVDQVSRVIGHRLNLGRVRSGHGSDPSSLTRFLARTALRYRRAYILPTAVVSSCFFFFFCRHSISEVTERGPGSPQNLDTYSLMTAIWKIWSELPWHLPLRAGGKSLLGDLIPFSCFVDKRVGGR